MPILWPPHPSPETPPTLERPRYVQETFAQAVAREPRISALSKLAPHQSAAAMFDLADTRPGYSLVQVFPGKAASLGVSAEPAFFVFRRIDPPRYVPPPTF